MASFGTMLSRFLFPPLLLMDAVSRWKDKGNKNSGVSASVDDASASESSKTAAKNVYNYNYLNDSNTGNTLFSSQQKTKRTLFGE